MALNVLRISRDEWKQYSASAHRAVFKAVKPAEFDRIDYALLCIDTVKDEPTGYVTVRELDHETVYWQFGGGFPWAQKSIWIARTYDALLNKQAEFAKRMTTRIENTNLPMLKLALSKGLIVFGVRTFGGETLLELGKDFDGHSTKLLEHAQPKTSYQKAT